jgi:hypothetical protein
VYYTLLPERPQSRAGDDAVQIDWFDVEHLPAMAFDHGEVAARVLARLGGDSLVSPVAFQALPQPFAVEDFRDLCQAIPSLRTAITDPGEVLSVLQTRDLITADSEGSIRVHWERWSEPAPWL